MIEELEEKGGRNIRRYSEEIIRRRPAILSKRNATFREILHFMVIRASLSRIPKYKGNIVRGKPTF